MLTQPPFFLYTAYGYAFRRHKRRIEDGIEVNAVTVLDDRSSQLPAMQQVDLTAGENLGDNSPTKDESSSNIVNNGNNINGNGYGYTNYSTPSPGHLDANGDFQNYNSGYEINAYSTDYPYGHPQQAPHLPSTYDAIGRQGGQQDYYQERVQQRY